jgi:hypothetical protein
VSTLAVNAVTDANGGNTATINSMTPTADSLQGFRNRIINGDMRIDQRNAGAAVTVTASYPVDRFQIDNSTNGAFSAQQDSSAPTGFNKSFKLTITTAQTNNTGNTQVIHRIEGFNTADFGWGTANAKTVTLSFWVRSSSTGTFGGSLRNSGNARSYPFSYSISAVDTWEYKTVAVSGDTSGTWLTDNSLGVQLSFSLYSSGTQTAGAWFNGNASGATGQTQLTSTLNATWYVTGVQLEVGSVATPFERRPFGTELALCQRYCYSIFANQAADNYIRYGIGDCWSTTKNESFIYLPVTMRIRPSITTTGTASNYAIYSANTITSLSAVPAIAGSTSLQIAVLDNTVASGLTAGRVGQLISNNNTTSYIILSAEL